MAAEYWYEDETGTIVYVPMAEVMGEKKMSDGSMRFKLVGGPYHDAILRVYPPYDTIRFPNGLAYSIRPPLNPKRSKKWIYVHDVEESRAQ